ncbi:MAG TPA: FeoA family protein [Steroidobacter sp.]|nr:FeoA family protein [Steroidobacter sp.]
MSAVLPMTDYVVRQSSPSLADLRKGQSARIVSVTAAGDVPNDIIRRLSDLGFLPGEFVRVLARGPVGGEPIAVRVGAATFGLRRQEAQCIRVDLQGE